MILIMWNQNDIVRGELKNISFDIKADVSPDKEEHLIVLTKPSMPMSITMKTFTIFIKNVIFLRYLLKDRKCLLPRFRTARFADEVRRHLRTFRDAWWNRCKYR